MTPATLHRADAPIGVFDSGVGGLSVLRHIRAQLPLENLVYLADSGFAPYGNKPESVVAARSLAVAGFLVEHGAKALVVACNTATVAAIKLLRAHYPQLPIVGVEPGLKPAASASRNGKIGVLATEVTLAGEKFLSLREQISSTSSAQFLLQGCPGLVEQIERGELVSPTTDAMLDKFIFPLLQGGADTLVLGCTHYPFVRAAIERSVARATAREVLLVDTGDAVARQLARLLTAAGSLNVGTGAPALLQAYTTGNGAALTGGFSSLLGLVQAVSEVQIDVISKIPAV